MCFELEVPVVKGSIKHTCTRKNNVMRPSVAAQRERTHKPSNLSPIRQHKIWPALPQLCQSRNLANSEKIEKY